MEKYKFINNVTHLPVTMQQFEDLTNEILVGINELCRPHFLSSDYMAQILMSAIHALDHKHGYVSKADLFESCVNRISCHITYHAVEEIKKKLNPQKAADPEANNPEIDNPEPILAEVTTEEAPQAATH